MEVKVVTTEQELKDAFAVRKEVFVDEQKVPLEEEMDQYDETATHFVLYKGGIPQGAGRFRILDGIGKVERICVLATLRGHGAGKAIMRKVEETAKH